jgi:MraZ protein
MAEQTGNAPKRFYGYIESAIDEKGRVMVDKKNRDRLGADFVAAMMPNGCLGLYRQEDWRALEDRVLNAPSDNQGLEHYTRFMFGHVADDLNCDSQGRFVLPQWLRESAHLKGEIVLQGAGSRLEIWNAEEFKRYMANPFEYGAERRALINRAKAMMREENDLGGWDL